MSNSPLVDYIKLSPNHSGQRNQPISKITPHYVAGDVSIEVLGEIFAPVERQASSNYGIGSDGRIGMYVEECNRAWTSSSAWNDNRAVTIECANLKDGSLTDACWQSLVDLCVDICQRNGITDCTYTGDTDGVLTKHLFYSGTDCPGPWLTHQFDRLSAEVNARLNGLSPAQEETKGHVSNLLSRAQMAAEVMYHLVTHEAHGYSQLAREGDGTWEDITLSDGTVVSVRGGDKDCSEGVRMCYEAAGVLGDYWSSYLWTGVEYDVLTSAGFITVDLEDAQVGDVLLRSGHTELVIEVDGQLMQAGFRRSETYGIDGEVGDQDGYESTYSPYNPYEWETCFRYAGPERAGYGEYIIEEDWSLDMSPMYIINVKDDHRINPADERTAMLHKGWQVLWTQNGGFKYMEHPDSIKLLNESVKYWTGKEIPQKESSSKAPVAFRLYQATALNAQNTVLKDRWIQQ